MAKERPPLEEMTLRQLRRVASEYGISRYSRMRKEQLRASIFEAQRAKGSNDRLTLEAQEAVEAAKFELGQEDRTGGNLSSVDEGLADLPAGYGSSRIVLMPRDPQWAYAYWDIPNERKEELRRQGGQQIALRLYDVTDLNLEFQSPHSIQEYPCDELAREWYLPIPVSDRDYVVDIGYRTGDGRWLVLARCATVHMPPIYPSDWIEDQFISVSWEEDLRGKKFLELVPPSKRVAGVAVAQKIFGLAKEAEAQRVAGSVFGSMQQVPGSIQAVSSYGVSSYGVSSYGVSSYGVSSYGVSSYGVSSYGVSSYLPAVSSYVPAVSSYGVSSYEQTLSSYAVSSYVPAVSSYGVSSYGLSSYEQALSSYAVSSYVPAVSSYGLSSYGLSSSYEQALSSYAVSSYVPAVSSYGLSSSYEQALSSYAVSSYVPAVSSYGLSSYGLSSYEQALSSYAVSSYVPAVSSYGLSSYGLSSYGLSSSYEQALSSYAVSSYVPAVSSYGVSSYGLSSYEQALSSYAVSSYVPAVSSYGVSSYGLSSYEQALSSYAVSSYALSSYEQAVSSYALSSYAVPVSSYALSSYALSSYEQAVSSYALSSYAVPVSSYALSSYALSSYEQAASSYALSSYAVPVSSYALSSYALSSYEQAASSYALSSYIMPSGVGMWALPTESGMGMSGVGFSASIPPIRPRQFWLVADAELIVYGATEPDATVTIGGRPIKLNPDGTFRFQISFQDGVIDFPVLAVAADGEQTRSIHMEFTRETPSRHTNSKEEAVQEWLPV